MYRRCVIELCFHCALVIARIPTKCSLTQRRDVCIGSLGRGNAIKTPWHSHFIAYRLDSTRHSRMKLSALQNLFKPSKINISGSLIPQVAGDSHTYNGDGYNLNDIAAHASKLRRYVGPSSRIGGFPWPTILDRVSIGAAYESQRPSSSMSSWNADDSIGGDRNMSIPVRD